MHTSVPVPQSVDATVARIAGRRTKSTFELLPVLQDVRSECGGLASGALRQVADTLHVSHQRAAGVASFYSLLGGDTPLESTVRVCDGVVCWLHGAAECRDAIAQSVAGRPGWHVTRSSCLGLCDRAPAAFINGRQIGPLCIDSADAVCIDAAGPQLQLARPRPGERRRLLERAGRVDPTSIDESLKTGVYGGLNRAMTMAPDAVISELEVSGLCGRGGAGFPTARKWRIAADTLDPIRYVICNADESEPLMFKDRVLLESDPHAVLEGLAIAAYAVGAQAGIVYIRGEYAPQAQLLELAVAQAEEHNWLGERIQGSGFSFHVQVHRGAGAYICGEESALLESLEGRRGEPRIRPPFPTESGYHGHPTVVNNVETLATAAAILRLGVDSYRQIGSPHSPGTRLFTLTGHVAQPGLVEVPSGLTLQQMIDDLGGGMRSGSTFHFALTSGAAGTIVGTPHLDVPLDDHARAQGVSVGSGGLLLCDESVSPVSVLRELLHFFESESCGKCTPCRIGTAECRAICDRLLSRAGTRADLARLRQISATLRGMSLCGLGTSAAEPIDSALDNFPEAFQQLAQ